MVSVHDGPGDDVPQGEGEQVLDMDANPGVGHELLESLPPGAVVAYRGEPTASERAMLCWPMSEQERDQFASAIARVGDRLQTMNNDEVERFLNDLGRKTEELGLTRDVPPEEVPGSQDLPEERSVGTNGSAAEYRNVNGVGPARRSDTTRFIPHFLTRG